MNQESNYRFWALVALYEMQIKPWARKVFREDMHDLVLWRWK